MSDIKAEEIGKLKPGRYIVMDNQACEIKSMDRSAPGKHGHAKYRVTAISLTTGAKKVGMFVGHDKVDVPIIEKKPAQVLSVAGDTANIMDSETYETFDIKIPDEFKDIVEAGKEVIFWNIMGEKVIKSAK